MDIAKVWCYRGPKHEEGPNSQSLCGRKGPGVGVTCQYLVSKLSDGLIDSIAHIRNLPCVDAYRAPDAGGLAVAML